MLGKEVGWEDEEKIQGQGARECDSSRTGAQVVISCARPKWKLANYQHTVL